MLIPKTLIVLPFLIAFVLCLLRFYQDRTGPGVSDVRFVTAAVAIVLIIVYLIADVMTRSRELLSEVFFGLSLATFAWAIVLYRRPLPKPGE